MAGLMAICAWPVMAAANTLKSIESHQLPNNQLQVVLDFASAPAKPLGFSIENPAKIALDFTHTRMGLSQRMYTVNTGTVRSIAAAEAGDRTRLVFNLTRPAPYTTRVEGHRVIVTIGHGGQEGTMETAATVQTTRFGSQEDTSSASRSKITDIEFHRGKDGGGLITLTLSNPNQVIDLTQQAGKVVVEAHDASLSRALQRRMVVTDFGTPVERIDSLQDGRNVKLVIAASGDYEQLAYQADNKFTVDIKPVATKANGGAGSQPVYKGQRISLNFQNIPVRSVLQLLADFTGLNIVVSDAVTGSVTLRLKNVPWDQALAIILQAKGLAEKRSGNVIMIAPASVIEAQDQQQIRAQRAQEQLAPLHTEIFQVRYAKAATLAALLQSIRSTQSSSNTGNNTQTNTGVSGLSSRGSVVADPRTNSLIIRDTDQGLANVAKLIQRLDVPVKQVLIGSRLVVAKQGFSRDLGVTFGSVNNPQTATTPGGGVTIGSQRYGIGGYPAGNNQYNQFNVNLPAASPTSTFGLTLVKLGQTFNLSLQLSAAEAENQIRQISNPRVITANDTQAMIQQGVQIPYQQASSSGATNVSFKTAALKLLVTPHITPNNRVLMELDVSNDSVGGLYSGVPSINTQEVKTQVMVDNGQTVVLGGIYQHDTSKTVNKVPFFGDLPVLGTLFRENSTSNTKTELLIFITPKIIDNNLSLSQ
ncbi:Type IV pilus biogenesis protein PilQ [Acidihalobacter prosperus]|uniref:Type IV pilus biogenesis protein PilQ n=2 Tax=Acidihalobacter prosperus TaxID=160660 RepID=A0A1A6C0Z3_9GAMM|nr:Type IV pilus biogenesis protein PilQ [Acidihalobacter prosperus]